MSLKTMLFVVIPLTVLLGVAVFMYVGRCDAAMTERREKVIGTRALAKYDADLAVKKAEMFLGFMLGLGAGCLFLFRSRV